MALALRWLMPLLFLVLFAGSAPLARADLLQFGPVDPANGYPAWYQDKTGLALDSCINLNQAELDGGWCLLLPVDLPTGTAPEDFPDNFAEEHFYWSGVAEGDVGDTRLLLVLALEEAFGNGPVEAGDQVVFTRTRVRIHPLPFDGDYTVYTPYGKFDFPGMLASDPRGIFFSEDIGLAPGDFTQAMTGRVGPFLLPSATLGGAEMAALTAANPIPDTDPTHFGGLPGDLIAPLVTAYPGTGKSYIADPARIGPVTGSTLPDYVVGDGTTRNPNIFRVEGPNGFVFETFGFALSGRIFEGAIAGDVKVDRASYARSTTDNKVVDVYATATPAIQGRLPASPPPASVPTVLAYFDEPCTATPDPVTGIPGPPFSAPAGVPNQMIASGSNYFGQSQPAAIPLGICLQANAVDAQGQTVTTFTPAPLADQVFITEALFDPASRSLSVSATSSDELFPPTLTVEGLGDIDATGRLLVSPLFAPPEKVTVLSSARGLNQMQVSTGPVVGGGGNGPVAVNDTPLPIPEEAATTTITVLANDLNVAGGTVSLVSLPLLGTAAVNTDGSIAYTPNLNATGTDSFTYRVTVGALTSNIATVSVTINPVNDAPVANADSAGTTVGTPIDIPLVGNDTDVDGDALSAVSVSTPAGPGIATVTVNGGSVSFSADTAGTYMFTYQASDGTASSAETPVTVTVAGSEVLDAQLAQYRTSRGRWVVSGTSSVPTPHNVTISYADGTSAGFVIGTAVVDALGNWALDIRGARDALDPRTSGATQLNVTSKLGGTDTIGITIRR